VVFVTHDITEALLLGDRVTVLSTQPARVALDLKIEEPRPRNEAWLRTNEAMQLSEQIITNLRHEKNGSSSGGQIRVTV
jgi:NitT/TauT family transport system ATP-binding protein